MYLKGTGNHTSIGSTGPTLVLQNTNNTTNNIVKLSFESASAGETVSINAINTNHSSHYGDMAFNTRGSGGYSEKMRIMANGNVGIGKIPSTWYLDVDSTDGYIASFDGSNNTGIAINSSSGIGDIIGYSNSANTYNSVGIRGASGTGLVVDTSNNVGIGTSSPSTNLDVYNGSGWGTVHIDGTSGGELALQKAGTRYGGLYASNTHGLVVEAAGGTNTILFLTSSTEHMRLDSAGTLFLGTSTPTVHSATTGIVFENGSLLTDVTRAAGRSITLAQNASVDTGNTWAYLATDEASYYQQFGGNHYFGTAPSGNAGTDVTFDTKLFVGNTGNVGIGASDPAQLFEVRGNGKKSRFTRSGSAGNVIEYYYGGTHAGGISVSSSGLGISEGSGEDEILVRPDGNLDANAVKGRVSAYVQNSFHIGSDKHAITRYSPKSTYVDGTSSNYQGYVYSQETYIPPVFIPYSPNQVYRLSASIHQLTNATGGSDSRHYIGLIGYDENFNFLNVDAIGTYQYNMASNVQIFAGNSLEVDITIKGWQGSGGSDGNKMDQGTVYIRPLILFNYNRAGGTTVLTGFNIQPAGTVADNDSNAGTNY